MPSTSTSPTTILNDAVAAFVQTANHALALSKESIEAELTLALQNERHAQGERDELRRERDALMQEKIVAITEREAEKRETERWKAATEKAEWTVRNDVIDHQSETIVQLRREAQQWKDQFMRVEDERARLSARIDELVSQQLYANRRETYHQEPLTPRSQGPQALSSASSSSNRGDSSGRYYASVDPAPPFVAANGYVTESDVTGRLSRLSTGRLPHHQASTSQLQNTKVPHQSKPRAGPPSQSKSHSLSKSAPTHAPVAKQNVIRRVHAVIEVPVKEESVDSEQILTNEAAGIQPSRSLSINGEDTSRYSERSVEKRRAAIKSGTSRRRKQPGALYSDDEEDGSYRSGSGSESDEDEYLPTSRGDDEDEDELMMGVEDNRTELYSSERVTGPFAVRTPPRRAQTLSSTSKQGGSSGKRNSPYPNKKVRRR